MYPSTRYQGSKLKLVDWLWEHLRELPFDTALDVFGGTATVSLLFKRQGKTVHFNDRLRWNAINADALVANPGLCLSRELALDLVSAAEKNRHDGFISETFRGIYFTDDENRWLDGLLPAIRALGNRFEQALAYRALFQSCLVKRPYNLFHRKNLAVRTANVPRSFGNKATWDAPFAKHFLKFVDEANGCVFDNGKRNLVSCLDAADLPAIGHDLVYLDPPYTSAKGVSVDYHQFYHFLEGLVRPEAWKSEIDFRSKHLRLKPTKNIWCDKKTVRRAFEELFEKHRHSILVVSYRSQGLPSLDELASMLARFKSSVRIERRKNYRYALSTAANDEILLIGT